MKFSKGILTGAVLLVGLDVSLAHTQYKLRRKTVQHRAVNHRTRKEARQTNGRKRLLLSTEEIRSRAYEICGKGGAGGKGSSNPGGKGGGIAGKGGSGKGGSGKGGFRRGLSGCVCPEGDEECYEYADPFDDPVDGPASPDGTSHDHGTSDDHDGTGTSHDHDGTDTSHDHDGTGTSHDHDGTGTSDDQDGTGTTSHDHGTSSQDDSSPSSDEADTSDSSATSNEDESSLASEDEEESPDAPGLDDESGSNKGLDRDYDYAKYVASGSNDVDSQDNRVGTGDAGGSIGIGAIGVGTSNVGISPPTGASGTPSNDDTE